MSNAFLASVKELEKESRRVGRTKKDRPPRDQKRVNHLVRLSKYGLTEKQFAAMRETCRGLCAICAMDCGDKLVVDHCHKTGKVRGLLCGRCNAGLGMFMDSAKLLMHARAYLNQSGTSIEQVAQRDAEVRQNYKQRLEAISLAETRRGMMNRAFRDANPKKIPMSGTPPKEEDNGEYRIVYDVEDAEKVCWR